MEENYNKEIIDFGRRILIEHIVFFTGIVILGILTNTLLFLIIFCILFIPLRVYCGGYHSTTRLNCRLLSFFMFIIIIKMYKIDYSYQFFEYIVYLLCFYFIFSTAPIDTPNKRLDDLEKNVYGKRARKNLSINFFIYMGSIFFKSTLINKSALYSVMVLTVLMLVSIFKENRFIK